MKIGVKVGDVMDRNFISVKPTIDLFDALKLMVKKRASSLIIEENGFLKGLLTERDILWVLTKKKDLSNIHASEVCTKKITTIKPSADIYDAIKIMKKTSFKRLPVTVKKRVVGLLSLNDILKIQLELFEIVKEFGFISSENYEKNRELIKDGICEKCYNFDSLCFTNGRWLCANCNKVNLINSKF